MTFYLYGSTRIGIEKLPYLDRISIAQDHSPSETMGAPMTKDNLVEKIKELLKTDVNGSGSGQAILLIIHHK